MRLHAAFFCENAYPALAPTHFIGPDVAVNSINTVLDNFDDSILVVDDQARIKFNNRAAEQVLALSAGLTKRGGRLVFAASDLDNRFRKLLADQKYWAAGNHGSHGFRAPRQDASKDWLVIVSAWKTGDAEESAFLVQLIGRRRSRSVPMALMQQLFDLSKREVEVIAAMNRYRSLHAIATTLNLSHETVRTHVKRIFRKCEVSSRSELATLVQRITVLA